jgi:hypothetical protein
MIATPSGDSVRFLARLALLLLSTRPGWSGNFSSILYSLFAYQSESLTRVSERHVGRNKKFRYSILGMNLNRDLAYGSPDLTLQPQDTSIESKHPKWIYPTH